MSHYLVATTKPWNIAQFNHYSRSLEGNWRLITSPEALTLEMLEEFKPRYIFFPHWSWIVPKAIHQHYECVCFHMTDLPYGRGGSPLQNLISQGHKKTMLSALRMTTELDAGPIYLKEPLSLEGKAQQIFEHMAQLVGKMIKQLVEHDIAPTPQQGIPSTFKRRTPEMSELPQGASLEQLYDHIRMLDAEGYPKAYTQTAHYRMEFSDAEFRNGKLTAVVEFKDVGQQDE